MISVIKNDYNRMYGAYKEEFTRTPQKGEKTTLKCFAAELWTRNEQEILKKFVLAEAYKKSLPDN
jgi:hypothetical protein